MFVITAPTGQIGRQLVDILLAAEAPLRLVARQPERLPAHVRARVEIIEGSHGDADVVQRAFAGADAVFWLVTADPRAASVEAAFLDFSRPACEAFVRLGVKRVVGISALGRGTPVAGDAGLATGSLKMDDMIAATGVGYRALTMPTFIDNTLRQAELIRTQGIFASPFDADRNYPTCATRDIAAVAARLLLDPSWTGQGEVPVLGPEDLSCRDMVGIMSDVLGKPIQFRQVSYDDYKAQFTRNGVSEAFAQAMVDMARAKNAGLDNAVPRTAASSTPTSFRQWCEDTLKPAVAR
jgi:uncharacterized protein YbjT (DUF2867 family)